uniref:Protein kinase domain-containing protein n=1 Tax=Palpitomonas bilix TaxID=652834 RepID=A0A7S3DGK5_9EUKA|mmetsp:Transcript_34594/g.89689  ORF Transcript_34594/g.89689 Transcript_34594/m.89689 type:complete len:835 (+) Transcript_34594:601-3105(+)
MAAARLPSSYEEFEHAVKIGKGASSIVERARWKEDGSTFALKRLFKDTLKEKGLTGRVIKEIEIHHRLRHPHIVRSISFFEDEQTVTLVLEHCSGGNLLHLLRHRPNGRLEEDEARPILASVASALSYLHRHRIVHRDVKPSNILICSDGVAKLSDFGMAAMLEPFEDERLTLCGTPNYISPEIARGEPHTLSTDVWSFGCLCLRVMGGILPFQADGVDEVLNNVAKGEIQIPSVLSAAAADLIRRLLNKDAKRRMTFDSVLAHPYFTGSSGAAESDGGSAEVERSADAFTAAKIALPETISFDESLLDGASTSTVGSVSLRQRQSATNSEVDMKRMCKDKEGRMDKMSTCLSMLHLDPSSFSGVGLTEMEEKCSGGRVQIKNERVLYQSDQGFSLFFTPSGAKFQFITDARESTSSLHLRKAPPRLHNVLRSVSRVVERWRRNEDAVVMESGLGRFALSLECAKRVFRFSLYYPDEVAGEVDMSEAELLWTKGDAIKEERASFCTEMISALEKAGRMETGGESDDEYSTVAAPSLSSPPSLTSSLLRRHDSGVQREWDMLVQSMWDKLRQVCETWGREDREEERKEKEKEKGRVLRLVLADVLGLSLFAASITGRKRQLHTSVAPRLYKSSVELSRPDSTPSSVCPSSSGGSSPLSAKAKSAAGTSAAIAIGEGEDETKISEATTARLHPSFSHHATPSALPEVAEAEGEEGGTEEAHYAHSSAGGGWVAGGCISSRANGSEVDNDLGRRRCVPGLGWCTGANMDKLWFGLFDGAEMAFEQMSDAFAHLFIRLPSGEEKLFKVDSSFTPRALEKRDAYYFRAFLYLRRTWMEE